jgi:hypothetical protein
MLEPLRLREKASGTVDRAPKIQPEPMRLTGRFVVEHVRDGKVLGKFDFPNGITDVGMNHILTTEFNGGTPITAWYIGLIDNAGFSALAAGDTSASHAGWAENTDYSETERPEWTAGNAAARAITNAATVDFSIDDTAAIKGIFIISDDTKGGSTGTLWSTAAFGSVVNVQNGDTLKVTYTLSG